MSFNENCSSNVQSYPASGTEWSALDTSPSSSAFENIWRLDQIALALKAVFDAKRSTGTYPSETLTGWTTDKAIVAGPNTTVTSGTNTITVTANAGTSNALVGTGNFAFTSGSNTTTVTVTGVVTNFGNQFIQGGSMDHRGDSGDQGTTTVVNGSIRNHRIFVHTSDDFSIGMDSHGANSAPGVRLYKSGGTHTSPTVTASGTNLGVIATYAHDGTDYGQAARIRFFNKKTTSANNTPGYITLETTSEGTNTNSTRMQIDDDGVRLFGHKIRDVQNVLSTSGTFSGPVTVGSITSPGAGTYSERFGASSSTGTATSGVAVGPGATVDADFGVAVGADSWVQDTESVAVGYAATTAVTQSIAIGASASTTDQGDTVIGYLASAVGAGTGLTATAIGHLAAAGGASSLALGGGTTAALNGVAIGANADAALNSLAIGAGASANSTSIAILGSSNATGQCVIGGGNTSITTVYIGKGITAASPATTLTIQSTGGSGTDKSGTAILLQPGMPTGASAIGGYLSFLTPKQDGSGTTAQTPVERLRFKQAPVLSPGEAVFNDSAANYDLRVEGMTNANLLFIDASEDSVTAASLVASGTGVGVTGPLVTTSTSNLDGNTRVGGNLTVIGNVATSGTAKIYGTRLELNNTQTQTGGFSFFTDSGILIPLQIDYGNPAAPQFSERMVKFGITTWQWADPSFSNIFFSVADDDYVPELALGTTISGFNVRPQRFEYMRHNVAVSGTSAETDLINITIPGSTMGTGSAIHYDIMGDFYNNSGAAKVFTIRMYWGGTKFYDSNSSTITNTNANYPYTFNGKLANLGSTTSQYASGFFHMTTPTTVSGGTGGLQNTAWNIGSDIAYNGNLSKNTASSQAFRVTVQLQNAISTLVFNARRIHVWIDN